MERVDRDQYLHRPGRSERHSFANRQSRCDNSQPGVLYHAPRGETDTRRADRHALHPAAVYDGGSPALRNGGAGDAEGRVGRDLP